MASFLPYGDSLHEECGVVGLRSSDNDVARLAFFGLFALQHRGQESAGIASADGSEIHIVSNMGLVNQVFREEDLEQLVGNIAIGHTRYSTTGSSTEKNAQPCLVHSPDISLAVGHNGNITNAQALRTELIEQGIVFRSTNDTEVIAHLLACSPASSIEERCQYAMKRLQGAYSLVILTKDKLVAMRDPMGVRPFSLGKLPADKPGWVVASETCALDHIGAVYERDIDPGEIVVFEHESVHSIRSPQKPVKTALCSFEHIYFSRPDSILENSSVYMLRRQMGARLFREHPVSADVVIGIPDSATPAAEGFAQESGIPYSQGLTKNRYVGRTFIQPDQGLRDLGVRMKFNPLTDVLKGKKIVVVDDSIVRGTTTPHVINLLRKAGAKEVHLRVCAPPIRFPCHFGVDMATRKELIANQRTVSEVQALVGADSLGYLSVEGLHSVLGAGVDTHCDACFTGDYPIPVQLEMDKLAFEPTPSRNVTEDGQDWRNQTQRR